MNSPALDAETAGRVSGGTGQVRPGAGRTPAGIETSAVESAEAVLQRLVPGMAIGSGARAYRDGIDAGQRMLGNRAFLRWVDRLRETGRPSEARSVCAPGFQVPGQSAERAAPLQLMGKKKKKQGAAEVEAGTGKQAAGSAAGAGAGAEGTAPPPAFTEPAPRGSNGAGSADDMQGHTGAGTKGSKGAAAGAGKKKKKSRVQVALNTLRGEGVAAFGGYVEAEIGETELLRTLVERIMRAEDLAGVRKEALGVVEGRLCLLASGGGTGVPEAAAPAPGRQGPEFAVIAPVKTELTWMERELFDGCVRGDIGKFRRFLKHGVADINMGSTFGTLLCVAAYLGHTRIVRELLPASKIDINLAGQTGVTPLYCAAQNGQVKIVELLLAEPGINVNLATAAGATPLFAATLQGYAEIVALLLAAPGINVNPVIPENNSTPLQCAVFMGYKDIAELLLAAPGLDIDSCAEGGSSLLFIAIQSGFLGIVEQLVRHGVAVNPVSSDGATPLYAAINSGDVRAVRILLTGRDTRINQPTGDGIVPLGFAVSRGHKDIVELLLRHGADPNARGITGLTALHLVCLYGYAAMVRMLLDEGADADAEAQDPDREGQTRTPGSLAELGGHREVISILAAHRRRREAARSGLERMPVTGEPGKTALPPPCPLLPQSLPLAQAGGQAASPDALSPPNTAAGKQGERAARAARDSEVSGEQGAAGQATARVSPVPPAPSPPPVAMAGAEPPTPLALARDALRQEVLGKLQADNFDWLEGIRLLQDVNDTDDLDSLCVLYNRLAHIERIKERARRRKPRRGVLPAPPGAGQAAAEPAAAPEFALGGKTGLDAERVEVEMKQHLDQRYHRFVSQAVNDMEFGRGKRTAGHPELWHVSAGIPGVGSCSAFYYLDAARNRIRIVGTGHHVGRAAYQLDYAAEELGAVGRILRIA